MPSHEEILLSAASAATAFAWYAMPDVLRSRQARVAARTALLVGIGGVVAVTSHDEATEAATQRMAEAAETNGGGIEVGGHRLPTAIVLGLGSALLAGTVAMDVVIERRIFARGERRRAQGVTAAHTRMAVAAAALVGVMSLVDDTAPALAATHSSV